jgi:predicted Zn-ribbon and HTH transcriptional regulator
LLKKTSSKFCYDCNEFPCERIKNIDKRYQAKYRTSLIQNLKALSVIKMDVYLQQETIKWTCKQCGSVLSVHNTRCSKCGTEY